jgi:hypothetical protein
MSKKKKNNYEKQAQKKSFLGEITAPLETKGDMKNTAIETGKDVLVGVIGGGVAGAAIGRASLAIGALITGIGHYTKNRLASIFGIGMMASGGLPQPQGVSGTEDKDMLEGVKERVLLFRDSFKQKLFLDKLKDLKKDKQITAAPVGEVQYFNYPETTGELGEGSVQSHIDTLNQLERQIAASGEQAMQMKGILSEENFSGEIGNIGELDDPSLKNY